MPLQFQTKSRLFDLHFSTGLTDWDMDEEMKLTTTTDQFYQDDKLNDQYLAQWHYARISRRKDEHFCHNNQKSESFVQPNLWLMVNPNLACPIKYAKKTAKPTTPPKVPVKPQTPAPQPTSTPAVHTPMSPVQSELCILPIVDPLLNESLCDASSFSDYMLTDEEDASVVSSPVYRKVKTGRKRRTAKASVRRLRHAQSKCLQRALQDSKSLKLGGWPRPPVNYCILIAMALSSCHTGSLNVQQIYTFTKEHFPFFQTAPDGWKNTIRHNLCFSDNFRKAPHQMCGEGKRKSCLWHLTLDGRRRLRNEIHNWTGDSFRVLKRSMNHPDLIQALFAL